MRNLILVRHAKSSWKHNLRDQDRPLSSRGNTDAYLVSKHFRQYKFVPDKVFSSPANRALTTCKVFIENLSISEEKLSITDDLYDFGGERVLNFIHQIDDAYNNVMLFGHNHAFTFLTNHLGTISIDNLPTCGLVKISFDTASWQAITKGKTKLVVYPKLLKT